MRSSGAFLASLLLLHEITITACAQIPASPRLSIDAQAGRPVVIGWTNDGSGLVLEQTASLAEATFWQAVPETPQMQNGQFQVTLPSAAGSSFFRLHTPPLTSIRESSPVNGESGVAVTRETIVRFTTALADSVVLTTNSFYAGYGGQCLLARVELSSDRSKATLFYLEPLPGSTRITAVFDGAGLFDVLGRPLDVDGDGVAGGSAVIAFDTLNLTALAGTAVVTDLTPGFALSNSPFLDAVGVFGPEPPGE